jgi:hypothetical protein
VVDVVIDVFYALQDAVALAIGAGAGFGCHLRAPYHPLTR